ncbi:hypothetical protein ACLQ8Z_03425 [Bordetella hinzii]|uniref:hypothetical protein n=1 Tax=Bordetella hinzii TaxID=103855 RepID=UPI0039FDDBEE
MKQEIIRLLERAKEDGRTIGDVLVEVRGIAEPVAAQAPQDDALTIADYEEVLTDHRRLVRELDVLLNGDGAAQQASLCDIVSQVRRERIKAQAPAAAGDARKELTAAQIEACAQEMAKYAESCRRAAKDVPILVDLYTAQALSGDMAARYLRAVIEKHGSTDEAQQSGQGAGR